MKTLHLVLFSIPTALIEYQDDRLEVVLLQWLQDCVCELWVQILGEVFVCQQVCVELYESNQRMEEFLDMAYRLWLHL